MAGQRRRDAVVRPISDRGATLPDTLSVVLSIFGLIGLGYLAARTGFLSASVGVGLSDFVFNLAIPIFLFRTLATADLHGVSPWRIWFAYFVGYAIVWVLAYLMIRRLFGRDIRAGIVAGASAAYGNTVLIGVPLMQTAFGDDGTVFLIIVVSIHLPLTMLASVGLHEWTSGEEEDRQKGWAAEARRLTLTLVTNPVMIGIACGALWRATGLDIPVTLAAIIDPLSRSAGPLALFATGMALLDYGMARQIKAAAAVTVLKLALMPALVFAVARALSLPAIGVASLTLTAALPTGVTAFVIARGIGAGEALASNALVISTALGVLTVTLWLMAMQAFLA